MARVTIGERILAHLSLFTKFRECFECPQEITQRGIAESVGISRPHAALELKKLKGEGMVDERMAHVRGARSRLKVYSLTHKGQSRALQIRQFASEKMVKVKMDGKVTELPGGETITLLKQELSIPECQALGMVLRQDVVELQPETVKEPLTAEPPEPFFGREKELGDLMEWLESNSSKAALIIGVPGVGKTSLCRKLASTRGRSAHLLTVNRWDSGRTVLRAIGDFLSGQGKPRLRSYMESGLFDVNEAIMILAHDSNANLYIFDDCDKSEEVLSLIETLLKHPEGSYKLIGTAVERPSFCYSEESLLEGKVHITDLKGLDQDAVSQLLAFCGSEADTRTVYDRTGGHPLSVRLLASFGLEEGSAKQADFIYEMILGKLTEEERELLRRASVLRPPFPEDAIGEANPLLIHRLQSKGLLHRLEDGLTIHDLLRDFFLSIISQAEKRDLHSKAADFYLHSGRWQERLYHLVRAGRAKEAIILALRKERELVDSPNLREIWETISTLESEDRYRSSLELLKGKILDRLDRWDEAEQHLLDAVDGTDKVACEAKVWMGRIKSKRGSLDSALNHFKDAAKLSRTLGNSSMEAQALLGKAIVHRKRGDFSHAREAVTRSIELAKSADDYDTLADGMMELGILHLEWGRLEEAFRHFEEILELVKGNPLKEARARINLGITMVEQELYPSALNQLQRAAELAYQLGQMRTLGYALANVSELHTKMGNLADAEASCQAAYEIFSKLDDPIMISAILANRGNLERAEGEFQKAISDYQRSIEILESMGIQRGLSSRYLELADLLEVAGERERARELRERGSALSNSVL